MLKSWFKRVSLMLTIILLLLMLMPATAAFAATGNYVALGDSISYGLTDPQYGGYTQMFRTTYGFGDRYKNLSLPGYTTSGLLNVIGDSANSATIRGGNIFTISIGSNNLLGPAIQSILALYKLDMNSTRYTGDLTGKLMIQDLAEAVKTDWTDNDGITPDQRFSWLMDPKRPEAMSLNANWAAGTTLFKLHWPLIMTRLRVRAPLAKIYVNNLYNPLIPSMLTSSNPNNGLGFILNLTPLYLKLDGYMKQINSTIAKNATMYRYRVADVYTPFAIPSAYSSVYTAPLTFNIPMAVFIARNPEFTPSLEASLAPFFFACDPHPTTAGHKLIFEQVKTAVGTQLK